MIPSNQDSLVRLFKTLSLLGNCDLAYQGVHLTTSRERLPVVISDTFYRKFTCVEGCSVCCSMTHTLDLITSEGIPNIDEVEANFELREVEVTSGSRHFGTNVWTRLKVATPENYCPYLVMRRTNGHEVPGCSLWPNHPLECAAAVNMRITEHKGQVVRITKQPMARAWRYDPTPQCEFAYDENWRENIETNIHLFDRYRLWAEFLGYQPAELRIGVLVSTLQSLEKPERLVIL